MTASHNSGHHWHCGRFTLSFDRPLVMGILNVTPDSFSDGGRYMDACSALERSLQIAEEGADILDVGGESTRPGCEPVIPEDELARVEPVVRLLGTGPVPVCVDTRRPLVARACVDAGASAINDVSGFRDPEMVRVAEECDAGLVVMHMLGEPETMQLAPEYEDVVAEVVMYLAERTGALEAAGVDPRRIVVDPGIGFGKTLEHNLDLLTHVDRICALGYPVLIGASRKSFIGTITGVTVPEERVGGSVAAAVCAAERGADIVRVHDVRDTVQALAVAASICGRWPRLPTGVGAGQVAKRG